MNQENNVKFYLLQKALDVFIKANLKKEQTNTNKFTIDDDL